MDPNPKTFPVLSYVLSRLNSIRNPNPNPTFDPEQPPPPRPSSSHHVELVERMPGLDHPDLLASMARAISEVSQSRSVLRALGPRPDHETVDVAKARVAALDAELSSRLHNVALEEGAPQVDDWRRASEEERKACRAVLDLDEMHEAYEGLLREAEAKLVGIYKEEDNPQRDVDVPEVDDEVVAILREAAANDGVEKIDLSGRGLPLLPEEFGRLKGLLVLVLSDNQLETIPDSIAGLELLEELWLSSNLLTSLPDSIGLLLNLKILDVSGNKLKALPDSISQCRSLVELDASFNELAYLPTNIGHELSKLQKLNVHLNKLRSLPMSICELSSLRHLDAHFNELHGLPPAIGNLINLEFLDLSSNFNDLTELPESFCDLLNLKELNLSNNQIHSLPDRFGRLDNLVKLNLDQNPIVIPPKEVVNEGVQAVKDFMSKRLVEILMEEQKSAVETVAEPRTGWLTRSTSWLSDVVTGVSGSVSGYLGADQNTYKDPCLDQQF